MTPTPIRAVLFDMGGTLEDVYYDDSIRLAAMPGLMEIMSKHGIDPGLPLPDLYAMVNSGMKKYGRWREESERELLPERVWPEFVFPDLNPPKERLAAIAEDLAFYYDTRFYKRSMRPEVPALLEALRAKGLRLAVISNIYSRGQVTYNLARYGIERYFEAVVLSSCFGWRKPHPSIFLEGARLLNLPPATCAYVGDTISRDVSGARRAGYGLAIQIKSFLTTKADTAQDTEPPDAIVQSLMQVVDLIETRLERAGDLPETVP